MATFKVGTKFANRQAEVDAAMQKVQERKEAWSNEFLPMVFDLMRKSEKYPEFVKYYVLKGTETRGVRFEFENCVYTLHEDKPEEWISDCILREIEEYEQKLAEARRIEAVRQTALTKLTAEERAALGWK